MSDLLNEEVALMSLDDYIKNKFDRPLLLDYRKKNKQAIDKDKLDDGLDKIALNNASKKSQRSKFDRFRDDEASDSSSESEDEEKTIKRSDSDVQMMDLSDRQQVLESENSSIRFAKEIQQMEHPKCCQLKKHFKTVESEQGIKIQSQQWRLEKQRKASRFDERPPIRVGRIEKKKPKTGIFVEKGNFTYKFADINENSNEENAKSIIGIVRNKQKFVNNNNFQTQRGNQPININVNLNGIVEEVSNCIKTLAPAPVPRRVHYASSGDDELKIAAGELLEFLKAKRDKASKSMMNGFNGNANNSVNEYIINATAGDGIENMNFVPNATNLPLNLRFA